ncbi:hypothetical protein M5689_002620 [Euphorbia peplus]|nr:hypothetical protein M5689_002620 [Euphorbia peplus]
MAPKRITSSYGDQENNFGGMKVKAVVDKEKNKVLFAECDKDFVDVLFSFFTLPIGTIVSSTDNQNLIPTKAIGCMNNLYSSVKNLDVKHFRTPECQEMLLHPRNGAPTQCKRLKISIDDIHDQNYFFCERRSCMESSRKILFHNEENCDCCLSRMKLFQNKSSIDPVKSGAFLKGPNQLAVSDDLQLINPPYYSSFSLLSDLGVTEATALETKDFYIRRDEFLILLKRSLLSKGALTRLLLPEDESQNENMFEILSLQRNSKLGEAEIGKIRVKLFISKSKKIVCFAEVGEDFIDLVFSFLTIPLGHVMKQMQGASIDGCIDNLYKSIEGLDIEYFNSSNEKEMLLNPKIPPKFGYENQLLGVEEVSCNVFLNFSNFAIKVRDPKIPTQKEDKSNGGFMAGPEMFTVTDDLNVIPISAVSGLNILNKLDVSLSDVQELVVYVGKNEAVFLLVASFGSEYALTHTFLKK